MHEFIKGDSDYHEQLNENFNELLTMIYPIGAIYQSTIQTDPATLFGGTWERIKGRVLVGVDESDSDFSVGKTGGAKTHKLTIAEMPRHSHENSKPVITPAKQNGGADYGQLNTGAFTPASDAGGDQPHNNLQPYTTVYMWKRTA